MSEHDLEALLSAGKLAAALDIPAALEACRSAAQDTADGSPSPVGQMRWALGLDDADIVLTALFLYELVERAGVPSPESYHAACCALGRRCGGTLPPMLRWGRGGVELSPVCRDFLLEREPELPACARLDFCEEQPVYHGEHLIEEVCRFVNCYTAAPKGPAAVLLHGETGSGRRFLLGQAARRLGGCLLLAQGGELGGEDLEELTLAAALYNAFFCIENYTSRNAQHLRALENRLLLVFLTADDRSTSAPGRMVLHRAVGPLSRPERLCAMRALFAPFGFAPALLERAAGLYPLRVGQMQSAAAHLSADLLCRPDEKPDEELLLSALRGENRPGFSGCAHPLSTTKRMADLVLPAPQKRELERICAFARARSAVYRDWGFAEKIPYGRGISVLFYGASGTGKTMAASVLANELGLELYRVDLAQITSKYIGETQKNIGRIFDEAQSSNCILFFDEADALFARRSEVSDAQDRYSNGEVAYLLQKTEQHEGVTILATNLLQNFDEAFRRRITFMLRFPLPDAGLREALWRGIFPASAPLDELDYRLLAEQFELSGAGIKNCALNAALLAMSEGTRIGMREIVFAVKGEYDKLGKTLNPQIIQMFLPEGV